MTKELNSIFDDMTDEELEQWFKECGIPYEKVEKGKGGIYVDGIDIRDSGLWYN